MKKSLKKISIISVSVICFLLISAFVLNYFYPLKYIPVIAKGVRYHSLRLSILNIPYVKQWREIYPTSWPSQSGMDFYKPERVNLENILFKRYYLFVTINVKSNFAGTEIASYEKPIFKVKTIKNIFDMGKIKIYMRIPNASYTRYRNNLIRYEFSESQTFNFEDWEKFISSNGDLSVLGIQVIKDKPIHAVKEIQKKRKECTFNVEYNKFFLIKTDEKIIALQISPDSQKGVDCILYNCLTLTDGTTEFLAKTRVSCENSRWWKKT